MLSLALIFALTNAAEVIVPCATGAQCLTFGFTYQSGLQAVEGMALLRGYIMWANKTNAQGGIKAKAGQFFNVSLLAYDDQSNATKTAQGYTDLIKIDMVNYTLGPFGSSYTAAAINVTKSLNKLLVFSQAADDSLFNTPNPNNVTVIFGLMTEGSDYMHSILTLLYAKGAKTIVVLRSTTGFSQSVWQGLLSLLKNDLTGMTILYNLTYVTGSTSESQYQGLVNQIKTAVPNPDVFISLSLLQDGPNVTLALRTTNYQPQAIVMTSSQPEGNSLYVFGPEQWTPNVPRFYDQLFGDSPKYNQDYLAMFPNTGEIQATQYSAGASASGFLFAQAIGSAASLDQADVRDALEHLGASIQDPFQTFFGNVTFNALGQNIAKEMLITQVFVNSKNNSQSGLYEKILVGPGDYSVASPFYPIQYGCNDSAACNYLPGSIQNNTCRYPPNKNTKPAACGACMLSSSFAAVGAILAVSLLALM